MNTGVFLIWKFALNKMLPALPEKNPYLGLPWLLGRWQSCLPHFGQKLAERPTRGALIHDDG